MLGEVQRFVLRPNVSEASQYYASVFMNQMILTRAEPQVAHTLLLIYLALFSSRAAGASLGSRMLSCLLSGLHRAIPFCDAPETREATGELLASQLSTLFRCAHAASFSTAIQSLMVLSHATAFTPSASGSLLSRPVRRATPSRAADVLQAGSLPQRALQGDQERSTACACRRLCKAAAAGAARASAAHPAAPLLLLLSEVTKRVPSLKRLLSAPAPKTAAAAAADGDGGDGGDGGGGGDDEGGGGGGGGERQPPR